MMCWEILTVAETSGTGWWWIVSWSFLAFAGYLVMLMTNPAHTAFRDGFRSLKRYPTMGLWLSFLGGTYFIFQLTQSVLIGEIRFAPSDLVYWPEYRVPDLYRALGEAWLPALDWLAGLFNQGVACYPVSALVALLFLINWRGYHRNLFSIARARLGYGWFALYIVLILCTLAAVLKPVFEFSIGWLNHFYGGILLLRVGAVIDWLSFQFEYLFGTLIQIYLILLTFVWIRGLNAKPSRIYEMAVTRMVYVAKWAGIILVITSLLIHLPLLISYLWISQQTDFMSAVVGYIDQTARPLLGIGLILFCSMQINLTLGNRTLTEAIYAHAELARKHWYKMIWFLWIAGFHLVLITWVSRLIVDGFPVNSVPVLLTQLGFTVIKGFIAAWCLASWVCFYRTSQQPKSEVRF